MSVPQSRANGWASRSLLTLVAYLATGALGMLVTIPPSFASPLYPAAGLALVAVLTWGKPAALAVALGSACINFYLSAKTSFSAAALLMPACAGLGAMLQAVVGAGLIRRFVRQPPLLAEPRDLLRFYLLAALSCLISATVALAALTAVGILPPGMRLVTWGTWAAGDALGTLVGAPIALTLIGQPRAEWTRRRLTVGLPLLVVTVLMALGIQQMVRLDADRERAMFEREASSASGAMQARLREPLRALEAVHGVFLASDDVTRAEFKRATAAWLLPVLGVEALGWHQRVMRAELPRFEALVQAEGVPH